MDNFYNRLMPKLPLPKTEDEKKAREESNRIAIEELRKNPNSTTYLGMTGVGNDREFTNPVAPIASAYNNAGGGFSGVGGVLGAAGRTAVNQVKDTYNNFAQPFLVTMKGMIDNAVSRYNLAKTALPAANNAVSDVAKGVSSGYTGIPVDNSQENVIPQGRGPRPGPSNEAINQMYLSAATPANPMTPTGASDLNGVMSYLGNPNALQDLRDRSQMAQEVAPLISSGFRSLNNPAINAPISGRSPGFDENILVKERFGTPQEYNAAVQSNQNAARFGQQSGLESSLGARSYAPNDATKAGMQYGGAITEYAIPGKGQATFMGQRQGGGTLSVLGGRTPEEQAAIEARVNSIDSQTAALRGLRNANRQEQGLMTVEQEQQLNAMRQMMGGLAPSPDTSRLDEQQSALMQQLKDAQGIKGFGKRREREDAMKAAQLGLAQLAGLRGEQSQQYGQQLGMAQSLMQNQTAQESAQAKALQDQAQFLANFGNAQEANQIAQNKNELDAAQAGQRAAWEQKQFGGNAALKQQEIAMGLRPSGAEQKLWYMEDINNPGKPILNKAATGLSDLPSGNPQPGGIYLQGEIPVRIDEDGNPVPIEGGLEQAVFLNRAMQMKRLGLL